MADQFDVSEGGAYAVLFSVLTLFTILAIISAGYGAQCLPLYVRNLLVAKNGDSGATVSGRTEDGTDGKDEDAQNHVGVLATDFFL